MFEAEWKRMQKKLNRLMNDHLFTRNNIFNIPETEWKRTDDNLNKRVGLYQLSNNEGCYKVYFKGLVSVKTTSFAGVGVAIYDARDRCVFELRKAFFVRDDKVPVEGYVLELRGLVEGLHAAVMFGLKRVNVYCDSKVVYQYLTGKERPTNKMTLTLVDALILIQRKIGYRGPFLMKQSGVKCAYKLAKTAIASQANNRASKSPESVLELCTICSEYISKGNMFSQNKCSHRYCHSCMSKYVESKLLQGQLPNCPHETCKVKLEIKSCKKFLNKRLYDIMSSRILEATIPPTKRIYCPFPKCSVLMSKIELQNAASSSSQVTAKRKCSNCHQPFCMNCKVPWHDKYKCSDYIRYFPDKFANDVELKSLATRNRWRQCIKCMHMIELAKGCHHISCRCGYEFCYRCGNEWINKKATCKCPLWDDAYIIYVE